MIPLQNKEKREETGEFNRGMAKKINIALPESEAQVSSLRTQFNAGAMTRADAVELHQQIINENSSLIKTNSGNEKDDKKKQRERELQNRLLLLRQMDQMLNDMGNIVRDMGDNDRKIQEGLRILKERDVDEARLFLMNEYDVSSEELEKMTDKEILEKVAEKTGATILKQDELKERLHKLAKEYEDKAEGLNGDEKQTYLDKLNKLEEEAKQYDNVDYKKAFNDVLKEGNYEYKLLLSKGSNTFEAISEQGHSTSKMTVNNELDNLLEDQSKEVTSSTVKPITPGMG